MHNYIIQNCIISDKYVGVIYAVRDILLSKILSPLCKRKTDTVSYGNNAKNVYYKVKLKAKESDVLNSFINQ